MINIIRAGRSSEFRHIGRTHCVCCAFLVEWSTPCPTCALMPPRWLIRRLTSTPRRLTAPALGWMR
eukprot:3380508-Prorocentrum_lima.AAC.1